MTSKKPYIFATLLLLALVPMNADGHNVHIRLQLQGPETAEDSQKVSKMEQNLTTMLTEINRAYSSKKPIDCGTLPLDKTAKRQLTNLYENLKFYCDESFTCRLWECGDGYLTREVPATIHLKNATGWGNTMSLFVEFDRNGLITDIGLASSAFDKELESPHTDMEQKRTAHIIRYCDNCLTAFFTKDTTFFGRFFDDGALVIVGKNVRNYNGKSKWKIRYKDTNRKEYLSELKTCFRNSGWVRATFDETKDGDGDSIKTIIQSVIDPDIYCVRIRMKWDSQSGCSDEGYLLLLWDFNDDMEPVIHVRAWQPETAYGNKLSDIEKFSLSDFGF